MWASVDFSFWSGHGTHPLWILKDNCISFSPFYFISVPLNLNVLLVYSLLLDYLISVLFVLIDHLHGFLLIFLFLYGIFFFFLFCVLRMLNFVTYVQIFFPDLYSSLNFNFSMEEYLYKSFIINLTLNEMLKIISNSILLSDSF